MHLYRVSTAWSRAEKVHYHVLEGQDSENGGIFRRVTLDSWNSWMGFFEEK